jgi:gas vesicle protein
MMQEHNAREVKAKYDERQEISMARNDSAGPFYAFLVGIGVGAAVVILLGPKKIEQLHDDFNDALEDGLDQVRRKTKDLRRQAQRTVANAQHKVQEAIDAGADAFGAAKNS